jgi:hypothetical protein
MSPRAASALIDLVLWGLPLYLVGASIVSRVGEHRRRRAVAAVRAVTPPAPQPRHVAVRPWRGLAAERLDETVSEEQWQQVLDSWTMPEQRRPA